MSEKQHIVILGAGFAGLETAFLLRMRLGAKADLTVVSERQAFTFHPNTIYVPFGADPADLVVDLSKPFRRRHVEFVEGKITGVDPDAHEVVLADERKVGYHKLVIATGADMRPQEIPGLAEHAATIWTPQSMLGVRQRFQQVAADAKDGRRSRVLFLIPPNNKCAGPLYEIVMMLETWLRREHAPSTSPSPGRRSSRQPVSDKGSRASAGAHAQRAGNPDRPARRQAHRTGAIAASPLRSPGLPHRENKSTRAESCRQTLQIGRARRCGPPESRLVVSQGRAAVRLPRARPGACTR